MAITNDLQGFSETSWIVTGYLITYTGMEKSMCIEGAYLMLKRQLAFMITWAKVSDILGRKQTIITNVFIFIAFSAGCGGSQTLDQL